MAAGLCPEKNANPLFIRQLGYFMGRTLIDDQSIFIDPHDVFYGVLVGYSDSHIFNLKFTTCSTAQYTVLP